MPRTKKIWRIAHRGFAVHSVENTLAAFTAAYKMGCDFVEFDVQLSADGIPILFHDDDLKRLAHRSEMVFDVTSDALCNLTLAVGPEPIFGSIPTLEAFLKMFGQRPFYLEIKIPEAKSAFPKYWQELVQKILLQLTASKLHPDTFVASFHPEVVRYALGLGFLRVALIHENFSSFQALIAAPATDPLSKRIFDSISIEVYWEALAAGMQLDPAKILLWNVKTREAFALALKMEVAAVVADNVPEMMQLLH